MGEDQLGSDFSPYAGRFSERRRHIRLVDMRVVHDSRLVDADLLHEALKAIHPSSYKASVETGTYDHAFFFERKKPDRKGNTVHKAADKVSVAGYVCGKPANLDILDLKSRTCEVAEMIRKANGL